MALDKKYSDQLSKELRAVFNKASERNLTIKKFSYPLISDAYQKHLISWREIQNVKLIQEIENKAKFKRLEESKRRVEIELKDRNEKIISLEILIKKMKHDYPLQFKPRNLLDESKLEDKELENFFIEFKNIKTDNKLFFEGLIIVLVFFFLKIFASNINSGAFILIFCSCLVFSSYFLYKFIKYKFQLRENENFYFTLSNEFLTVFDKDKSVEKFQWNEIQYFSISPTSMKIILNFKDNKKNKFLNCALLPDINRIFEVLNGYKNTYSN